MDREKDDYEYYSHTYDSEDAKSLLGDLSYIEDSISSIQISNIISSFEGNVCNETKGKFGNIEDFLINPVTVVKPIINNAISILSSAIGQFEKSDNDKNNFNLLLLLSPYLNLNILPDDYKLDTNVLFEGKMHTMFSQTGYDKNDLLRYYTFIFTDGDKGSSGNGHTVAGASCSMVAFLNGMVELYSLNDVMNMFGVKELPYVGDFSGNGKKSYHSLNESFLLTVNERITEEYLEEHPEFDEKYDIDSCITRGAGKEKVLNQDKIEGIEFTIAKNFKDKINYEIVESYQNLSTEKKQEIQRQLASGDAFIEFRLERNTSSNTWTHTGNGHYITAIDYKEETNQNGNIEGYYLIKDSAVKIDKDDSTINSTGDYNKARIAWRSAKELENAINGNKQNAIVVTKKEGEDQVEWEI